MSNASDLRITVLPHITWSTSNGEILLFNRETEQIFGLDHVAADAFSRLAENMPLSDVITALLLIYEVEGTLLARDLMGFLHSLQERNFIQIHPFG